MDNSTLVDDSGFNFEEDLVFSRKLKPFEYQFLKKQEESKHTVDDHANTSENESQEADESKLIQSVDEREFELSQTELSFSAFSDSARVLNSTGYNDNESIINDLLNSLIGKIDSQNILEEIMETVSSESNIYFEKL